MTWVTRFLVFLTSSMLLVGCANLYRPSFIQNRHKEYLNATSIPPLKIPSGISSEALQNYYPIPYRYYPPSTYNVSVIPPGL